MFFKRRRPFEEFQLRVVRFRKLLETMRRLMNLIDDAREKYDGDYIFDRQYIVSLVESTLEQLGRLVFDAYVLAPEGSETLYAGLDACREGARDVLTSSPATVEGASGPPDIEEDVKESQEFRLLADVLRWMEDPGPRGKVSVVDLQFKVFDHAVGGVESARDVRLESQTWTLGGSSRANHIEVVDLEPVGAGHSAPELPEAALPCKPFNLMLAGVGKKAGEARSEGDKTSDEWLAAVRGDQLSLIRRGAMPWIYLEASLTGHTESDFVLVFFKNVNELGKELPEGLKARETDGGSLFWSYDVPLSDLEAILAQLGKVVFGGGDSSSG